MLFRSLPAPTTNTVAATNSPLPVAVTIAAVPETIVVKSPPPPAPAISADARSAARGLKAQLEHALSGVSALLGADQAVTWIAVSVERAVTAPADVYWYSNPARLRRRLSMPRP